MKTAGTILIAVFMASTCMILSAADQGSDSARVRESKLDLIIRCQDRRTKASDTLERLAVDSDPVVRTRVYSAFSSLQDTSTIPFLIDRFDRESDPKVRVTIAYAIGQSARLLSPPSRDSVSTRLIEISLPRLKHKEDADARDRLIEELGKFIGPKEIDALVSTANGMLPPGHLDPLTRGIARAAINGVTGKAGTYFLLLLLKASEVDADVAYALQRCGDQPEIRESTMPSHYPQYAWALLWDARSKYEGTDPLVRMNIAALFGKLKGDSACVGPLCKMAADDPDWHVRVNAVRALGTFAAFPGVAEVLTVALHSDNLNIAVTAAAAAGNLSPADARSTPASAALTAALEQMTENRAAAAPWQLQAEAAMSLAKIEGADAVKFMHAGKATPRQLRGLLLAALGRTHAPASLGDLLAAAQGKDTIVARSALDALGELAPALPKDAQLSKSIDKMNKAIIRALRSHDVALVTTAAGLLGDSLFQSPSAVMPLVDALRRAKLPGDVEAMQAICETLGKLKDNRAAAALKETLKRDDRTVVLAAAAAMSAITGEKIDTPAPAETPRTPADCSWLRALTHKEHVDTLHASIMTSRGTISVLLFADAAPMTVTSFLKLAKKGFYRGLLFHRVVPNFVIQGGDPRGDGWGGPGYAIRSEFAPLTYETGTLGMASAGKDTEGSQFFITHSPQPHLDGRYTIFGKVLSGMDIVDAIRIGDRIVDVTLAP